ncbi:MAG: DUF3105 domain-containing protein [Chloroflexota bacterium]
MALLFVGSLLVPQGFDNSQQPSSYLNTGGPVEVAPDDGAEHIEPGTTPPEGTYSTTPPTSGPHWFTEPTEAAPDGAPARWGVYDDPLPDQVLIHNLEHGGIGLHYNCPDGCPELVEQLDSLIPPGASQFILAPYPDMDSRIAITSWRHLDKMEEFDEERILEFIDAYQDRAPESVPGNQF